MLTLPVLALIGYVLGAPQAAVADSDSIATIRTSYNEIERDLPHYHRTQHDLSGFSSEGGEVVGYFDATAVRKLAAVYYGEMGRSSEEYFFARGGLIFVLVGEERYDQPLSGHVVKSTAERFYFRDNRLIRWLDAEHHPRDLHAHDAVEQANELLTRSRQLVGCASAKRSDDEQCESTD